MQDIVAAERVGSGIVGVDPGALREAHFALVLPSRHPIHRHAVPLVEDAKRDLVVEDGGAADAAKAELQPEGALVVLRDPVNEAERVRRREDGFDGVAAAALDPKPRNLSDAAFMSTQSDDRIYKVISEGGASVGLSPMMAAWGGTLSKEDIWNVIAYIRQDLCKCQYKAN